MSGDDDQRGYSVTIPIGPAQPPSEEAMREHRAREARRAHGTDTVEFTVGETRGGNSDFNYTDNHGNRLNQESNNPGYFDFCANGAQLTDAQVSNAIARVRAEGTRTDWPSMDWMLPNQTYEFRGPNPIEQACSAAATRPRGRTPGD